MADSGIILPGSAQRADAGITMFVPGRYCEDGAVAAFRCTVPIDANGATCGAAFTKEQHGLYERHTGRCARQHEDVWRRAAPSHRLPVFDESNWDPEVAAHMRVVGARMLREGRMTVKPSERAGF